jgi:hypothetical protein
MWKKVIRTNAMPLAVFKQNEGKINRKEPNQQHQFRILPDPTLLQQTYKSATKKHFCK